MSSTMYSSRIWRGENSERSNLTICSQFPKLSVNCHIWKKKLFQKAYLRYISVYFGRESKEKRFIIHGEGLLLWRTDLAPTELQSYT